jgi:NAD(P)-dependent dehydrogenase (short-subunit alcohol dehydrogenase family)
METNGNGRRTHTLSPGIKVAGIVGCAGFAALGFMALQRKLKRLDYTNKVVLITGGSRGLGLVLARQLLEEGARVCICARDAAELARAVDILSACGGHILAIECDVANEGQVREMVRWIELQWGPVDVLINNAGVIRVGPFESMTNEDFEFMLDVHLRGPLHTINAVLPSMRDRRSGRIANIASIGGLVPHPHLAPYCASKFALVGLSQGLRAELAKDGIIVTTICPGLMRTGSHVQAEFKGKHKLEYAWFSIDASMPGLSQNVERAAVGIIDAIRYGRTQLTLTPQAKAAALANTVAPGLVGTLLGLVNRLLPRNGGIHTRLAKGIDSQSFLSPSVLTTLGDRAARRNNELNGRPLARPAAAALSSSSQTTSLEDELPWTET